MGFRRALAAGASQAALFACGAGALAAWRGGLYANAVLAGLVGAWIALATAWPGRSGGAPRSRDSAAAAGRFRAEAEQRRLQAMLDQTPAPLVSLGPDGRLEAVNRAARLLFGVDDRLPSPPAPLLAAIRAAKPGARQTVQLDIGSGPRAFALTVADAISAEGAVRLAALTDIQSELQAAEAQALRDLLQVLSHEIMNSLTPVASLADTASQLLADGTPESAGAARDAVETLGRRAEGLTRFVQGYRALARLPAPSVRAVRLTSLLDDVALLFRTRWGDKVKLEVADPAPALEAKLDPDLVSQALLNLLVNGAEAALEGGREPPTVWLTARRAASGLELTVRDNGPGVPPAQRDQLFRPFFTTKSTGTGVGLALARQIALAHGGDLVLQPEPPSPGAGFVLRL